MLDPVKKREQFYVGSSPETFKIKRRWEQVSEEGVPATAEAVSSPLTTAQTSPQLGKYLRLLEDNSSISTFTSICQS